MSKITDFFNPVGPEVQAILDLKASKASPTFTGTVSGVTKAMVGLGSADNTSDANKPVSTAQQTELNLKANSASPTFTGTVSGISKAMVGLGAADNTSDANKPVSTAQQTALNLKANLASPNFTGTVGGITKTMVGLDNVDNTSDANKPVSTAQQTALNLKANLASPTFTGTVGGITKTMVGLGSVDNTSDLNKPLSYAEQLSQATMSKVDFDALAEKRIRDSAGSGFAEWGKTYAPQTYPIVNEGIWERRTNPNKIILGSEGSNVNIQGVSRTGHPTAAVNGAQHNLSLINSADEINLNQVVFPPAPDGTKTYDSATGVVTEHGTSNEAFGGAHLNHDFRLGDNGDWTVVSADFTIGVGYAEVPAVAATTSYLAQTNITIGVEYDVTIYVESLTGVPQLRKTQGSTGITLTLGLNTIRVTAIEDKLYIRVGVGSAVKVTQFAAMPATESVITSRQDFIFLESYHESMATNDWFNPLGNSQYGVSTWDGITLVNNFLAQGYSAFGEWDTATLGYGKRWSLMTHSEKLLAVQEPKNNMYYDPEVGGYVQVKYRIRVIEGRGDEWLNIDTQAANFLRYGKDKVIIRGTSTSSNDMATGSTSSYHGNHTNTSTWSSGMFTCSDAYSNASILPRAIPICLVQRLNQGAYHPTYNPEGCSKFWDDDGTLNAEYWYVAGAKDPTSTADCFDSSPFRTSGDVSPFTNVLFGVIGSSNGGRPTNDPYQFYDAVYAGQVQDLRTSSRSKTPEELLVEYSRKDISGETRGKEGVPFTKVDTHTYTGSNITLSSVYVADSSIYKVGDIINVVDATNTVHVSGGVVSLLGAGYVSYTNADPIPLVTGTVYNIVYSTLLTSEYDILPWQDIIGTPANIATTFPNGVVGQWIPDIRTGLNNYALSKKCIGTTTDLILSTDYGVSWSAFTNQAVDNVNNTALLNISATHVVLGTYSTKANPYELANNSKVIGELGDVFAVNDSQVVYGAALGNALLGKVLTSYANNDAVSNVKLDTVGRFIFEVLYDGNRPEHAALGLSAPNADAPTVKAFPYITQENQQYYLQWVYKELAYTPNSFVELGDDGAFNIIDGEGTVVDLNGVTVKVGQKRRVLPYFIGESE